MKNPKKKMGRPRVGATGIMVRIPPAQLADLDAWIAARYAPEFMTRPKALRQMMSIVLYDEKAARERAAGKPAKAAARKKAARA